MKSGKRSCLGSREHAGFFGIWDQRRSYIRNEKRGRCLSSTDRGRDARHGRRICIYNSGIMLLCTDDS